MELIDNVNQAHKMWSVRAAAAQAILDGLYVGLPAVKGFVPAEWFALFNLLMPAVIAGLRVLKQSNLSPESTKEEAP